MIANLRATAKQVILHTNALPQPPLIQIKDILCNTFQVTYQVALILH